VLYFAYGSNLDPDQMRERCPGHRVAGLATLPDHRLTFPRTSETWNGGVASVQLAHGQSVWGVLYEVGAEDLARLDAYEGFRSPGNPHNAYERETVTVDLLRPADGSIPRRVRAFTYVAQPANPAPPSRRYLDAILKGARHHGLPQEWVTALAATPAAGEGAPARGVDAGGAGPAYVGRAAASCGA
jgi:cation transport regulator ChaC